MELFFTKEQIDVYTDMQIFKMFTSRKEKLFSVIFLNILLTNQYKIMQNLAHFHQYVRVLFENEIFKTMSN